MRATIRRPVPAWAMVGLPLLLAALICAWNLSRGHRAAPRLPPGLQDWSIPDLAEHLRGAGLAVRVVAAEEAGILGNRAYLTTTASSWRDLDVLMKVPERLAEWEGTVYCERTQEVDRVVRLHLWRGCCLCAGPFIFFGDPDLLERIRAALGGTPG
jgi:hypothetical protein